MSLGAVDVGTRTLIVGGLAEETQYFYRAFAQNASGASWAPTTRSFTTSTLSLPTLLTDPATDIGAFTATLSGVVTDPGGDPPVVTLYYGETDGGTNPTAWQHQTLVGERIDSFSAGVAGLTAETNYFFRASAQNAAGTAWSPVTRSFTTGNTPLIQISEFMSQNNTSLTTRTRDRVTDPFRTIDVTPDWIELQNLSGAALDVGGMHLTDDPGDPNQWQFPAGTIIPAGGYLVVFASGDNRMDPALDQRGYLHTNFSLSNTGEYVALTDFLGRVIDEYAAVPNQVPDISYGRLNEQLRYFSVDTPGTANSSSFTDIVSDTQFSVDRGFYDSPFEVEITSATPDAQIRYTLDGSPPSDTRGTIYSGPITISKTTTLRAIAYKPGFQPTNIDTQTYLFLDDVITQTPATTIAAGFPTSWNGTAPDYGMDQDVIGPSAFGGRYAATIQDDLKAIPTLSLVMDVNDMFGSGGVYTNPNSSTIEKPTSVEFFTADGSEEFQINAGVKVQGGAFRSYGLTLKKSLRLKFQSDYGPAKLNFPLFGDDATSEFDTLTLRMESNDGWQWGDAGGQPQYARDEFGRRVQRAMGQPASHGRNVHVYINGVYWGMYNMVERPDQSFGEAYVGANKDDWDGLNSGTPINADDAARANRATTAWNTLVSLSQAVASATNEQNRTAAFMRVQGLNPDGTDDPTRASYVDVENMIDYFLVNWYAGNSDWPHKNYYVGRENSPDSEGFQFFMWDAEWSLFLRSNLNSNLVNNGNGVAAPIQSLRASEEFRLQFADRVQQQLVNPGGPLYVDPANPAWDPMHPERNVPASIYAQIAEEIYEGLVAESARWGDQHRATPYTRDAEWQNEYNNIINNWFPQRSAIFLDQLRAANLYPSLNAPTFQINDQDQHGGVIASGDLLGLSAPTSVVTDDTVLLAEGASVLAYVPPDGSLETGAGPYWYQPAFSPAGWTSGSGGVGYEDSVADFRNDIRTNVLSDWNARETSVYTRFQFNLDAGFDPASFDKLTLRMKYDDGFVAYLNGVRVSSVSAPASPNFNSNATAGHSDSEAVVFADFDISGFLDLLQPGTNLLAVHGLNQNDTSSDLLISPALVASTITSVGSAPIYFTTDGTDPRALGGAIQGTLYSGELGLSSTTTVKARAFSGGTWSALNEVTFVVNPAESGELVISELNYNPSAPTAAELAGIGTLDNDDFEFIELINRGSDSVELLGATLTSGVEFAFPAYSLAPGARAVVVRNLDAFTLRYGNDVPVIGEFASGSLNNAGETIAMADANGSELLRFSYGDDAQWPQRADGFGGTLELRDPVGVALDQLGKPYVWQGSVDFGGSPGQEGDVSLGVVINEILAHTDAPMRDAVELYNPTDHAIDLSGLYLSDAAANFFKFEIPQGTVLPAGGYLVFDESDFNPTPQSPLPSHFALSSSSGESVWLVQRSGAGSVASFVDDVQFGASLNGVAFARVSDTGVQLLPAALPTLGCENRPTRLATAVISEVQYNPGEPSTTALAIEPALVEDDLEFIEIYNPLLSDIDLTDWRVRGGVDYDFAADELLGAGETLLVLSFNPASPENATRTAAFRAHYGIDGSVRLVGGYAGQLSDSGEGVWLQLPDKPPVDQPSLIPRVMDDAIVYDDRAPWSIAADGGGESLQRIAVLVSGLQSSAWGSAAPSPGTVTLAASSSDDLNGDGQVDVRDLTVMTDALHNGQSQALLDRDLSGAIDQADVIAYLRDNFGSKLGDANLDGVVDGSDFNLWNQHKFESCGANWSSGDFTGDGVVDVSDFNVWNANRFTASEAAQPAAARQPKAAAVQAVLAELPSQNRRRFRIASDAMERRQMSTLDHVFEGWK
jgi:hypothetical protein